MNTHETPQQEVDRLSDELSASRKQFNRAVGASPATEDRATNAQPLWRDVPNWKEKYEEEKAIVDRVWKALGIETYEQARGLAIDELVAASQKRVEALTAVLTEMPCTCTNDDGSWPHDESSVECAMFKARAALKDEW